MASAKIALSAKSALEAEQKEESERLVGIINNQVQEKSKNTGRHLTKAARHAAIVQMLGEGSLTQQQIARALFCSQSLVAQVAAKARPGTEIVQAVLGQYRKLVSIQLPITKKAKRLGELVDDTDGSTALRALKRADEITGLEALINPKVEQPGPLESRPLFNLPPGSKVSVTMSVSNANETDITPK